MSKVFGHQCQHYRIRFGTSERPNGAWVYTEDLEQRIIPYIDTDRIWVTYNMMDVRFHHAIVIVHNNLGADRYTWLRKCNDLILVCGVPETCDIMKVYGETLYLPLSVNVAEIEKHRKPKTKKVCYAGRRTKMEFSEVDLSHVPHLYGMEHDRFLDNLAEYEEVYAVGIAAIEAKVLGCKVLPFDRRFPDPDRWQVLDNADAVPILQARLDEIEERLK